VSPTAGLTECSDKLTDALVEFLKQPMPMPSVSNRVGFASTPERRQMALRRIQEMEPWMTDEQCLDLSSVFKNKDNVDTYLTWSDNNPALREKWIKRELANQVTDLNPFNLD
jgi:hypothetical protein